ncbi:MAG: AMP-binding protein, partial [Woeseiaceae bacterium]
MNIFELFSEALASRGMHNALVSGLDEKRQAMTYADLDSRIDALVVQLNQRGLRAGDRVLVAVPVSIETYIIMLALLKAGMVIMFIDPAHSMSSIA